MLCNQASRSIIYIITKQAFIYILTVFMNISSDSQTQTVVMASGCDLFLNEISVGVFEFLE